MADTGIAIAINKYLIMISPFKFVTASVISICGLKASLPSPVKVCSSFAAAIGRICLPSAFAKMTTPASLSGGYW
jgi:hypothetical protein